MGTNAGEFLQHRHHVERRGIAIGIFALRQRPRLFAIRPAGDERDQFEQVSGAGARDTSSINTSRSVLPLILVVCDAPRRAMI